MKAIRRAAGVGRRETSKRERKRQRKSRHVWHYLHYALLQIICTWISVERQREAWENGWHERARERRECAWNSVRMWGLGGDVGGEDETMDEIGGDGPGFTNGVRPH